uniref:Secreted protein n=1 Tax=Strombidinopsis acuminata TaxID=141414 RepID=A0A7S3RR13_9SPIT
MNPSWLCLLCCLFVFVCQPPPPNIQEACFCALVFATGSRRVGSGAAERLCRAPARRLPAQLQWQLTAGRRQAQLREQLALHGGSAAPLCWPAACSLASLSFCWFFGI